MLFFLMSQLGYHVGWMRYTTMKYHSLQMLSLSLFATCFIAFSADSVRANPVFSFHHPVVQAAGDGTVSDGGKATKPKKQKKAKSKKGGGVSFYEGSGETRAERDKRLTRECKGRSNSGLCEGYARP
jgi:hypothetical protein